MLGFRRLHVGFGISGLGLKDLGPPLERERERERERETQGATRYYISRTVPTAATGLGQDQHVESAKWPSDSCPDQHMDQKHVGFGF